LEGERKHEGERKWILSVDGASNIKGSGAGVILEGPDGVLVEQTLQFAFKASNNQAEYETLLAGMSLAKDMSVKNLVVRSDSQLVTDQVVGNFQAKDSHLAKYLAKVHMVAEVFKEYELVYVPRDHNVKANLLSKLESTKKLGNHRSIIQKNLEFPSVSVDEVIEVQMGRGWTRMYMEWFQNNEEPVDPQEATILRKNIARYVLIDNQLFRKGFSVPLLKCVESPQKERIMQDVHEGIYGSHIGGRTMSNKILRADFYSPTMREDCLLYVKRCDKCQRHAT